ncbi:hypothetical protein WJX77_007415 [Trebouxia sp. C0004]
MLKLDSPSWDRGEARPPPRQAARMLPKAFTKPNQETLRRILCPQYYFQHWYVRNSPTRYRQTSSRRW